MGAVAQWLEHWAVSREDRGLMGAAAQWLEHWAVGPEDQDQGMSPPAAVSKLKQLCLPHVARVFLKRH